MMKSMFALLALAVCALAQRELPYTECCTGCLAEDGVVSINPDSVGNVPGNFTITVRGTLTDTVDAGKYLIQARVLGIVVIQEDGDLCEDLDLDCPVPEGDLVINQEAEIPINPPFGASINVHVEAVDDLGRDIICADFVIPT